MQTPLEKAIETLTAPSLEAMGYGVVRVRLSGEDGRRRLQLMAERHDGRPITVDDCTAISHRVSALLEVSDPIEGAYNLEVSSPGIDRPLIKPGDFERYAGHEIKLETAAPVDGRRRFRGMLKGISDGVITITVDTTDYQVPHASVDTAKLVLTEALVKEATHG